MALKGATRLLVDVDDFAVWVTRQIHAYFDDDLGHLLVDLRLRTVCDERSVDDRGEPRTFFSGLVFLINGFNLPEMDVTSLKNPNSRS